MCLVKSHRFPKISRKPIKVYKIFCIKDDMLITPIQGRKYYRTDTIKSSCNWIKSIFKTFIEAEGVHAFQTLVTAEMFSELWGGIVVICEIPPYTPYWIGKGGEIAASKMKIGYETLESTN